MIKATLQKIISRHHYPQAVFAKAIARYIHELPVKPSSLIDCPCGNGETAWLLAEALKIRIEAIDRDTRSIRSAQHNFKHGLVSFETGDMESVLRSGRTAGIFCLINSLFLFPDAGVILKLLHSFIKKNESQLIVIIPNTQGKNFQWFQRTHPGENKLLITEPEIPSFFSGYGFRIHTVRALAYTHHFNRRSTRFLSGFSHLYLGGLNFFQKALRIGKPNYFLIALSAN